jgi:hypothetical protein
MGAAYYIVLEKKIDGLDTSMDGKRLAKNIKILDDVTRTLGVRSLSEFYSTSAEDLSNLLGEDVEGINPPPLEQFSAADGLKTVRALLPRPEAQPAIEDLRDCERILAVAAEHGVGWHIQIDI